ncbi:P-loop containing nucleoside triphosphate hydrolase protein [Zychaea mexicana]|uniref:P-loop containing nucleoside triphosphate hydrolase protein n=1 Tax=Zychaea mexicana TaxID=64656 RepID=UPI0022FEDD60|nr:P-loop containing nucleoside triphosphate hydrolase protein [Zychaea mexicana]KAI9492810.1 P-loop containing nucleoside triphosphate hydrolase protein [Zychaea mexicana]
MTAETATLQSVEVYTKGTKAWFTDKTEGWISTTCISNSISGNKVAITFQGDNDLQEYVFESTLAEIEKTSGANLPPLRNPPKMEYTDDLTNLSHLNEPSVLNTIRTRYMQHLIYTYSGIVLIAVNPFDRVALYDPDVVQQYSGKRRGELEPHLFAIAEDAYRCMIREQMNQTIVVSGESGAGKTVSAKYIMRYFATADDQESVGKKKKSGGGMTEVEEQILATNPIMEAFGNAKTTRNDNSSRFGKYIEIQFDEGANIIGAKIRTYLLERSRLIFQPQTERNYHIFYQLCAGAPLSEKKEFELGDHTSFHYLNQSGTGMIPGVDDAAEFEVTQRALSTVGLSVQLQWKIFRLLSALLHIGNIQIGGRGDAMLNDSDPALLTATKLMGINASEFRKWIVRKQIVTRSEKIVTNLTPAQAHVVKDSVAKYVYANLFEWLVGVINDSLSSPDLDKVVTFIGVLDIYGFEHFKKNSFEQFCINYANEKLQQQFNQHVFKLEQEEYVREKINWNFIEFSDNQKCIELIEARLGILSLLDEESRLPAGSDQGFVQKLYSNFATPQYKNYFKKPRFSNNAFTIAHYAHDVQYEAENFLDKNKDTVPDEHLTLLQGSDFDFLKDVLEKAAANNPAPQAENKRMSMMFRKPTLGSIFKLSLINLMDTIGQTNVHYIRCIKPNEAKVAWEFEPNMVLSQLRACGVLETIRISCAGYPSRWTFEEFADRYYALVSSKHWDNKSNLDMSQLCSLILDASIKDKDKYQVGTTKIFFRAGQLAYLEKLRADRYNECAVLLQKNIKRYIYRTRYVRMQSLAIGLQCVARRKVAQTKLQSFRERKAAITIQSCWRRYVARKQYLATQQFILQLQTAIRGCHARRNLSTVKEHTAAIAIQRLVRGWFARKQYQAKRQFIIRLQSSIRRRNARKQLVGLRSEARSANHFKEVSYKLENKIVELTQTLTGLKDEKKSANDRSTALEAQIRTWTDKYEKLEKKNKNLETRLQEPTVPQEQWDTLQAERDQLATDYKASLDKIKSHEKKINQLTDQLDAQKQENEKLQKAVEEAQEKANNAADEGEVAELKSQIAALKAQLTQVLHTPRRQQSQSNVNNRSLSPAPPHTANLRSVSPTPTSNNGKLDTQAVKESLISPPQQRQEQQQQSTSIRNKSPSTASPTSRKARRNSTADVPNNRSKTSIDNIRHAELLTRNPRPTSIHQFGPMLGGKAGGIAEAIGENPEEELATILTEQEGLQEEILEGLIKALKMPLPSLQNPPSKKEIFFPAHMIGMAVTEMWHQGSIQESERLLFTVMDTIQKQCLSFTGDEAIVPCAFWLSNVHELLSLICIAEHKLGSEVHSGSRKVGSWQDFEKLASTVKFELQCLEDNIFHAWMKELKKRLGKMVIPAIVEGQSLPGFITTDSGRFFNKLLTGSSQPSYTMDDLVNSLTKVWRSMKCYYIEHTVQTQVLTELLKLIGVSAFNDILMRKNFSSWKRAMQIQYNITRIEEWCKSHDIPEGTLQLEHLMQATKLLQFKKASLEDIENIYDVCWILSPTQIQKLISQYQTADYENPVRPEILKAVAAHVVSGDKSDVLLLDSVSLDDTTNPFEIPVPRKTEIQRYLPAWLNLKRLRRLTILVQYQKDQEDAVEATAIASP